MKKVIIILIILVTGQVFAQSQKDSLLIKNAQSLIQELEFIHDLDQGIRKYLEFATFNKSVTDSIENLDEVQIKNSREKLKLSKKTKHEIWKNILSPLDSLKSERLIEIIEIYGYPSHNRIEKLTNIDIDFNPAVILVHTPFNFKDRMIPLIEKEHKLNNFSSRCEYGWLLWHLNGRSDFKYMLENGYEMKTNADGTFQLISTCKNN